MKKKLIEIPYVKNASEWIFAIPEEYEAKVEDGKVIVKKKEPELTEFEKAFMEEALNVHGAVEPMDKEAVRNTCEKLLELAREELCKDCPSRGNTHAYLQGKADALNDLPKWKKVETNAFYPDITYSGKGKCPMLHYGEYEINIVKLKEALPKEEE